MRANGRATETPAGWLPAGSGIATLAVVPSHGERAADSDAGARPVWLHPHESERLESLASYGLEEAGPEPELDALARLAARLCRAPAGIVTLVASDRQWFKAAYGLPPGMRGTERASSICSDAVATEAPVVIEDTLKVPRYAANPLVRGEPHIRAYAGVPLIGRDALPLGTLCVVDWRPRSFAETELQDLHALARSTASVLELRRIDRVRGRCPAAPVDGLLDPLRMRRAIGGGEFVVHYQPIVDMVSGQVLALEALARWNHPDFGLLPPARFLPAMEETGLMLALGRHVLDQALDLAATLRADRGTAAPQVTVNVSGTELRSPGLADRVAAALRRRSLPPESLLLEVTESVPLPGRNAVAELERVRTLGVEVALDDFGDGTATIGQLVDLPITAVKLDRALVAAATTSQRAMTVLRSALRLAEVMELDTCVEGVETPEQRDLLVEAGARVGQGWLFSRPLPATELPAVLALD